MMIPWHPAAANCSTEAVTFSDTCPWSTYCTSTSSAFAAASSIFLNCDPSTSVEDQMETPILTFPDLLLLSLEPPLPLPHAASPTTIVAARRAAVTFLRTLFIMSPPFSIYLLDDSIIYLTFPVSQQNTTIFSHKVVLLQVVFHCFYVCFSIFLCVLTVLVAIIVNKK